MMRKFAFGTNLAIAMGAGPLLLYALSAMSALVITDLELSRTQFGSLATFAFVVAAASSAVLGRSVDRYSGRSVMIALYVGCALAIILAAVAGSMAWLLVAVAISGCAQSLSNPVTNRLISTHVVTGRRGLLMGTKQAGVQMSQFFAGAALPALALLLGWRGAMALCSLVAVVGLMLVRRSIPADRLTAAASVVRSPPGRLPTAVWWLAAYAVLTGAALQAANTYLPLFAYEELGLSVTVAGLSAAVVGGIGLIARIGFGHVADRMAHPHRALSALAGTAALGAMSLLAASITGLSWLMWSGAAIFGARGIATNVVVMIALLRVSPLRIVGTASGTVAIGLYLGFALGPISFGFIVDASGSYHFGWLAMTVAYGAASLLGLLWGRRQAVTDSTRNV
ncbi:sugar phosphate permease [Blastococcus colisei]|uniref:Sugar phosphate permease n=2 Tax=Blastococcus colisei TaxID=1564162 RepID=A0A543PIA4_9ACTN|nr:sugar phosphate permease [Blastococcus colisei]